MKRFLIILIIVTLIIFTIPTVVDYSTRDKSIATLDVVEVNGLLSEIRESGELGAIVNPQQYHFNFTIIDKDEKVVYSTVDSQVTKENASIVMATKNRNTIRDIYIDDKLAGWLIIYNDISDLEQRIRERFSVVFTVAYLAAMVLWIAYAVYLYRYVVKPFDKMKEFAGAVAAGDLDRPLEMDRKNVFGAFTESFDIMRDELSLARKREYEANVSKRELVAQLSHDIKTPVASIKAMSQVLEAKSEQTGDEFTSGKVKSIEAKADQIDTLISNLFASTLKELEQLEVYEKETDSVELCDLIKTADHESKVVYTDIPECLIYMDKLRAGQVISNVIYNSYKYAGTEIILGAHSDDGYLYISFEDKGGGVLDDDLPFVMEKFRRGSNAEGVEGTGLGLYISRNLMTDMRGTMECTNTEDGFKVTLGFRIV